MKPEACSFPLGAGDPEQAAVLVRFTGGTAGRCHDGTSSSSTSSTSASRGASYCSAQGNRCGDGRRSTVESSSAAVAAACRASSSACAAWRPSAACGSGREARRAAGTASAAATGPVKAIACCRRHWGRTWRQRKHMSETIAAAFISEVGRSDAARYGGVALFPRGKRLVNRDSKLGGYITYE